MTVRRCLPTGVLLLAVAAGPAAAAPPPGVSARISLGDYPSISANGRSISFLSVVPAVTGDASGAMWLMRHDRSTGRTERLALARAGNDASGTHWLSFPSASGDGRFVAFGRDGVAGIPGPGETQLRVIVHDAAAGTEEEVSVSSDGTPANDNSLLPSIAADGRFVAFESRASNLVAGDTNGASDIFVHDRATGRTERASVAADGKQGNGWSTHPSISADGRFVAFESKASNLVPADRNGKQDIFVHDRKTGKTERVSVPAFRTLVREALSLVFGNALEADGDSWWPSISADGRFVAFSSQAFNLAFTDANGAGMDIFVHDRERGTTERVSLASSGRDGAACGGFSDLPAISADGRFVAFWSGSSLAPEDTSSYDVYVHDRLTKTTELASQTPDGQGHDATLGTVPAISGDGRYVASTGFVPNPTGAPVGELRVRDRGPATGVGGITAAVDGGRLAVSGWIRTAGGVATEASDPVGDVKPGVHDLGGDLAGASVIFRPEEGDLLVRILPTNLPKLFEGNIAVNPCGGLGVVLDKASGSPPVVHVLELRVGATRYEVRVHRATATANPPELPLGPAFDLYRCAPACAKVARLKGGMGTTGEEIRFSLPLQQIGAAEGSALSDLRVYAAIGEAATGSLQLLDEVGLPAALLPARGVVLGVAAPGTPEAEVVFDVPAALSPPGFGATLDLPPGESDVWARACLGQECGTAVTRLTL